MRTYSLALAGTYSSSKDFSFTLIPTVSINREGTFWSLSVTWLNFVLAVFTDVEDEE